MLLKPIGFNRFIPDAGGADAYAVNSNSPEVVVDFADYYFRKNGTDSTFDDVLSFSRASAATRVDSAGDIQEETSGNERIPHYVWDGFSWVDEGIRFESSAATNKITQSESTTNWSTPNAGTVTTSQGDWPGGTGNAHKFVGSGSSGFHFVSTAGNSMSFTSGESYSFSIFAKAVGSQQYLLLFLNTFVFPSNDRYATFDLINGSVTDTEAGIDGHIEDYGDGWFRCTITGVSDSSGTADFFGVNLQNTGTSGTAENVNIPTSDGVLLQGTQIEVGSVPTSYIPTAGATVTRVAETLDAPAANTAPSTTALSAYFDLLVTRAAGEEMTLFDWRADANNRLTVKVNTSNAVILEHVLSGTTTTVTGGTMTGGVNEAVKIGIRCTTTAANIIVDGTAAIEGSTSGIPDLNAADAEFLLDGSIGESRIWEDVDLGDTELAAVTT